MDGNSRYNWNQARHCIDQKSSFAVPLEFLEIPQRLTSPENMRFGKNALPALRSLYHSIENLLPALPVLLSVQN
jgi:hypothetical protein